MKRLSGDQRATKEWSRFATLATIGIATLPVLPALLINIEQANGRSIGWMAVAIASVVAAPAFAEASVRAGRTGDQGQRVLFSLVALFLTLANILNALTNATHTSDLKSDHRKAMVAAAKSHEKLVATQSQKRDAQAKIAGELPVKAVEAEITALTATNADRWRSTDQCNPAKITAGPSRTFCAEIATITAKLEAAKARDKLDAELTALRSNRQAEDAPTVADPYAESFAALAAAAGYTLSEEGKRAVTASRDWVWAIVIELLAAMGPMVVIRLLSGQGKAAPVKRETVSREPEPVEKPSTNPIDDPVYAFIAMNFERRKGSHMRADEPWQMWLHHCAANKMRAGSQRAFGMAMKACYDWERNHNRPRYLNICKRGASASPVRLAVSNA